MRMYTFLQVILDVVYNHTNEADDVHPYATSFRGIDNKVSTHCCIFLNLWYQIVINCDWPVSEMNYSLIKLCSTNWSDTYDKNQMF